jgi:hypothetical protein
LVFLGKLPGPKFADAGDMYTDYDYDCNYGKVNPRVGKPWIYYWQLRGTASDWIYNWGGTWSQPYWAAGDCGGKTLADGEEDLFGCKQIAPYGGAYSWLVLIGKGESGGVCNTLVVPEGVGTKHNASGELLVDLANFKPGTYKVTVVLESRFRYDRQGGVIGTATYSFPSSPGEMDGTFNGMIDPDTLKGERYVSIEDCDKRTITVKVSTKIQTIVTLRPSLSGKTGKMKWEGQIWIRDIQRVD